MNDLDAGKIFLSLVDTYWCLLLIFLALSIGMNGLKRLNDEQGHLAGGAGPTAVSEALVARIRGNIAKTPCSISIGYGCIEKGENPDQAFSKANATMYEEKERYHSLETERIAEEKAKANQDYSWSR